MYSEYALNLTDGEKQKTKNKNTHTHTILLHQKACSETDP